MTNASKTDTDLLEDEALWSSLPGRVSAAVGRRYRIRKKLEPELVLSIAALILIAFFCFIWPDIYSVPDPNLGHFNAENLPPFSPHHLLGTDPFGDDELARLLHGGRVSLAVGFGSAVLGLIVGGAVGIVAGYRGGLLDVVISRCLDILLSFPSLILALVMVTYLGPSEANLIWAISFFSVPAFARLARSSAQRLKNREFMTAAELTGDGHLRVLVKHVAPNVFPELITFSFLSVGVAMIVEAALSFLGLGIRPPRASWGNMIQVGQQQIYRNPWLLVVPSLMLFATVLILNLASDAWRSHWSKA